jgi:hypothetical protein
MIKNPQGHKVRYLCKCKDDKDPYKYRGSGVFWRRIIDKLGCDIETEILGHYETNEELREAGEYYSELYDVVESKEWANCIPEIGDGGSTTDGWVKCYNPDTNEQKMYSDESKIPTGWLRGSPKWTKPKEGVERSRQFHLGRKRSEETRQKMRSATRKKRMTIKCQFCSKDITPQNIKRHENICEGE